jgi:DNA-directed RNA polymerase subunit RPC12/RpoP
MTTPVLLALGGVAVVVAVAWAYLRFRPPKEEPVYHFRCPGCQRRLRYRARQVGHAGQCPKCGRRLTFPPVGSDEKQEG